MNALLKIYEFFAISTLVAEVFFANDRCDQIEAACISEFANYLFMKT